MMSCCEPSFSFQERPLSPGERIGGGRSSSWVLSCAVAQACGADGAPSGMRGRGEAVPPPSGAADRSDADPSDAAPPVDGSADAVSADVGCRERPVCLTAVFSDRFLDGCASSFPELRLPVERLRGIRGAAAYEGETARRIAELLCAMRDEDAVGRLALLIRLLPLLSAAADAPAAGPRKAAERRQERLDRVRAYVARNAARDCTLGAAAQYAGMNKSAFCLFFRQAAGRTFTAYVNEYRIAQACKLLLRREMSVSEVCYSVGFRNVPYFNRTFRKIAGSSPLQFAATAGRTASAEAEAAGAAPCFRSGDETSEAAVVRKGYFCYLCPPEPDPSDR